MTDRDRRVIKHLMWCTREGHITQSRAAEIWGVSSSEWRRIQMAVSRECGTDLQDGGND
jgi:hypothetical protein